MIQNFAFRPGPYCLIVLAFVATIVQTSGYALAELKVSSDFEGASAVIEKIDQASASIWFTPAHHEKRGWPCWWYMKVTGVKPGQVITLNLGASSKRMHNGRILSRSWAMPRRACFSTDGKTWRHTQPGRGQDKRMIYQQKIDAKEAWFAWGPPFVPSDAGQLVERIAASREYATAYELAKTREGRPVPALVIKQGGQGAASDEDRFGIWIQARQHAWESGSSWVGRGFIEWLVSDDERAGTLRKKALIHFVPLMDVDNVAVGAGGKEQDPHDHNRDWSDKAIFAAVRAAIKRISELNEAGRFDLFVDLHNPGPGDGLPFYMIPPLKDVVAQRRANLLRLIETSKTEITGPMKFNPKARESGAGYDKNWKRISKNWVTHHTADHVVAVTLETSWNTPNSTTGGYQAVGRQLGLAIERYLRINPRARSNAPEEASPK